MKNITTSLARQALLLLAVVTLTNCSSKGFESSGSTGAGSSDNQQQGTGGGGSGSNTPAPIDTIDLQGKVDGNDSSTGFGGALSFDFDKARGEFIIMVPMPSGISVLPTGSFPSHPDITFSPIFDSSGKMKMGVRVPVKYILKGISSIPASSLPNGDPLPTMPAGKGELPSLALNFPQHNNTQISLYLGVDVVALYVTLPTNAALPIGFTLPIWNKGKTKKLGSLTYVRAKGSFAPGLFVAAVLPPEISRILEDYFKL